MSIFKFFVTGLLALLFTGTAAAAKKEEWFTLGTTGGAVYEISLDSARWIREPLSVQVFIRTKFQAPLIIGGKEIDHIIERTFVLCNEDMVIVMSQKQVFKNGKSINYHEAVPYLRPETQENLTSAILDVMCGSKPDSMKEPAPVVPPAPEPQKPMLKQHPNNNVTARKIKTVV